jgi:hypothetical protein
MFDIAITPSGNLYATDSEDLFAIDTSDASVTLATVLISNFGT